MATSMQDMQNVDDVNEKNEFFNTGKLQFNPKLQMLKNYAQTELTVIIHINVNLVDVIVICRKVVTAKNCANILQFCISHHGPNVTSEAWKLRQYP